MIRVLTIDPGDHTGTLRSYLKYGVRPTVEMHVGRTLQGEGMHKELWKLFEEYQPHVIIFERFALRAASAIKQTGSTFIVCEIIGIVKLYAQLHPDVDIVELQPSSKEYCGFTASPKDPHYQCISMYNNEKISEHVRDTFRLFSYWMLFKDRFKNKKQRV